VNLSTVQILERASELGLRLNVELPDTLTFQPVENCTPDFAETLRYYKPRLIALLRLPFVMVYSERLGETVFFCEGEDTKSALVAAGASEWNIYTKAELRTLIAQNRVAPFTDAELRKVHEIKRTFIARISE
jgi:hypothetical protein